MKIALFSDIHADLPAMKHAACSYQYWFGRKAKKRGLRGSYVILQLDSKTSVANNESQKVEFIRIEYDVEKSTRRKFFAE